MHEVVQVEGWQQQDNREKRERLMFTQACPELMLRRSEGLSDLIWQPNVIPSLMASSPAHHHHHSPGSAVFTISNVKLKGVFRLLGAGLRSGGFLV